MQAEFLRDRALPLSVATWLAGVVAWAVAAAVAFRSSLMSSFDVVSGNLGDGRLITYLHEHLFNTLRGRDGLLSPPFYYPQPNVLGYTDAFLLDALPYSALRAIGLDAFLAMQLLAITLSLCCFFASLIVCRRYLRLTPAIAVAAAVLITFPNNLMFKTTEAHPNFFAVYYVPCIVLLALWAVESFPRLGGWLLLRASLVGLAYGLLFATSFYVAWLFALTVLIGLGGLFAMRPRQTIALLRNYPRACGAVALAALAGFAVGAVPVLMIYMPVLHEQAGRSFRDFISFAPFPKDVINVGTQNLAWGWLVDRLLGDVQHERALAVTPLLTATLLALLVRLRLRTDPAAPVPWPVVFGTICAVVWAVSWLLTLRIGTFSAFWLPAHLIPGGVAIRAGNRIQLLVHVWVVAGLAVLLQHWLDTAPAAALRARRRIAALAIAACLVEQISLQAPNLPRREELARLASVPAPPGECQAFLVDAGQANDGKQWDAMMISARIGLPTLNGDSGWMPQGWRLEDREVDYLDAARDWIARSGLTARVCLYQRQARRWTQFEAVPAGRGPHTTDAAPAD